MVFTAVLDGAAPFVNQWNDTIDVREIGQKLGIKFVRRIFRCRCRTIHSRHNPDVVSRAELAVLASISLKCSSRDWRWFRWDFRTKRVVEAQFTRRDIVYVNPGPLRNWLRRVADRLPKLFDWLASLD